jgi:hypothetical protein
MDNVANRDKGDVIALLTEQRDLYRQLQGLADRQRGFITGNQPERLLTILAERQQLIDRLQVVSHRLRPFRSHWRELREEMDPARGQEADGLVAEVDGLLANILKQDEADAALLSVRKSETQQRIGAVQAGRQVSRAYAASYSAPSTGGDWT